MRAPSAVATGEGRCRRVRYSWVGLLVALFLAGCGGDPQDDIPPQPWKGYTVDLQTRPAPPVRGMNEFIVLISRKDGKPPDGRKFIVSIRVDESNPWKQMIQDGYMGVFRRAARVDDPGAQVLNVQIQREGDLGYLRFPLKVPPRPTGASPQGEG